MGLLGILSALLAVIAFVGNQYHFMENDDISYDVINFLSGVGLVVYALAIGGWPFVLTNTVWAVVSGIDIIKYFIPRRRHLKKHRR